MDSSNSDSLQSSSAGIGAGAGTGDNEEYNSTTQSISSFLNPSAHFNHLFHPSNSPSPFSNPNPVHNLDTVWSRPIHTDPDFTHFGSTMAAPNPSHMDTKTGRGPGTGTGTGSDHHHVGVATKNPKKRTRASRRAPTTVLTTDTSNFRQMVQEFTGIPTAPFSGTGAGTFYRHLDLLGRAGDAGIGPGFPLRPSAIKIQTQTPSFLNSTANIVESAIGNNITSSSSYQLPPSGIHEFQKQPSTLVDLQNPMLSFQTLLQTTAPQQLNGNSNVNGNIQQPSHLSGFPSSSKRWRGEDGKLESFEGINGNNENIGDYIS